MSPISAVGSFKRADSNSDLNAYDTNDFVEQSPSYARPSKIDYSKFKTRLCRHYVNGNQCPYEDRCAFSHGEPFTAAPADARNRAPPPSFTEYQSSGANSPVKGAPPPPPSYLESVLTMNSDDSPTESGPGTPPSYPSRFRYEPYSVAGIIYEH